MAVLYAREGADVAVVHLPEEQADAEETRRAVTAEGRRCLLLAAHLAKDGVRANVVAPGPTSYTVGEVIAVTGGLTSTR
ncbi:hypothetical protein [Streptomyces coelicoflavus]|uniref:hypothetical protein n=1 Tax=Streptomyces coelicoflavus TaxID=285562 RepID=UPI0036ACD2CC